MKNIWNDYVEFEISVLRESTDHLEIACQAINNVDGNADSKFFIKHNKKSWEEPADFVFESSPTFGHTVSEMIYFSKIK